MLQLQSVLDSYEGEDAQTVATLQEGRVMVQRLSDDSTALRLDTDKASYVSDRDAIYSVAAGDSERDVVTVYEGSLEIRTPTRTTRMQPATLPALTRTVSTESIPMQAIHWMSLNAGTSSERTDPLPAATSTPVFPTPIHRSTITAAGSMSAITVLGVAS